jgi:GNAT superfamily N-acetyltransferase
MYEDVILAPYHRGKIRIFLLKSNEGKIIGWASLILPISYKVWKKQSIYPTKYGTNYAPVYTYVHSAYRKLGYGRRILLSACKYAAKKHKTPVVFFWDEKSSSFFAKVSNEFPKLEVFDVSEWWDLFK